jgi:hypothetical protein
MPRSQAYTTRANPPDDQVKVRSAVTYLIKLAPLELESKLAVDAKFVAGGIAPAAR